MPKNKQPRKGGKHDGPTQAGETTAIDTTALTVEPPAAGTLFPIVALGASAGGLAALESFLSAIPKEAPPELALVLVQHLAPDHKSMLVELVQRHTAMRVFEASNGMRVEAGCIYIIPPNRYLALAGETLTLTEPPQPRGLRLPIDFFFRSLAECRGEQAIGIVLSGTGTDGTLGIRAIKAEGGVVMAQQPDTADYDGMPRSAIKTGLVDYVLAPAAMPPQLLRYIEHARSSLDNGDVSTANGAFLQRICALLHARTGHDFSNYKETTLLRRLQRRMALHQLENPNDYLSYQREHSAEIEALFRDLLIGVTSFFRDPEAFNVLQDKIIAPLLTQPSLQDPIRVWVCGCSTGEEAYSLAMSLHEGIEASRQPRRVQIFATDIDHNAVEFARIGLYPASIAPDLSAERLARYFTHDSVGGTYRIRTLIRDMVVFSEQDVIRDPPFSKMHLISCRNLLIYLNGEVQRKLIPLFHYALLPNGALFLGPSESVGDGHYFNPADRKWKIYLRRPVVTGQFDRPLLPHGVPVLPDRVLAQRPGQPGPAAVSAAGSWRRVTEQALLTHYVQAAILVDAQGEILHILGRSGLFLEPAPGDANMNILLMAREGLRRELTTALHKVVAYKQPLSYPGLQVRTNGGYTATNLIVRPAPTDQEGNGGFYLVILEVCPTAEATANPETVPLPATLGSDRMVELEQELRAKEEYLQSTLEEMETTNEELKSTNEEMQSINEELQSTNEELETSKEELQSVNEELSTVNTELQDKVADLSRANNDMNNLLAGTGIGTVFLDHQLCITRFTPAATQVINLIPTDVGRPVAHVMTNLVNYDGLARDVRAVLDTLTSIEQEVRADNGAWYLLRIRPYRTMDNVIEGAVLTFVDISQRKKAEYSLQQSQARFQSVVNQAQVGVAETDVTGHFRYVNDGLCELLGYSAEELLHMKWLDLVDADDRRRIEVQWEGLLKSQRAFVQEVQFIAKNGVRVSTLTRVNTIRNEDDTPQSLVAVIGDLSGRKRLEQELARADAHLARELRAISLLQVLGGLYLSRETRAAVYGEILRAAALILEAELGLLYAVTPNGALRLLAHDNISAERAAVCSDTFVAAAAANEVLRDRQPVIAEDLRQTPVFRTATPVTDGDEPLGAAILAPLCSRTGTLLGLLALGYHGPHALTERGRIFLDLLARQVADLFERASPEHLFDAEVPATDHH